MLRRPVEITLKTARERRTAARELVAKGINPSTERKTEKTERANARTFKEVAEEWRKKMALKWTPKARRACALQNGGIRLPVARR